MVLGTGTGVGTILLDEPTSALDLAHQLKVYGLIHDLHAVRAGPSWSDRTI